MAETISPQKLAREKLEAYQKFCIDILKNVIACFETLDEEELREMTFDSPSGDAWGLDNNPINFGFKEPLDALEAMQELIRLEKIADGEEEPFLWE